MKFSLNTIKSVRADLAEKEIIYSFSCRMTAENYAAAAELASIKANKSGKVEVEITSQQMSLSIPAVFAFRDVNPSTGEITNVLIQEPSEPDQSQEEPTNEADD